MTMKNGKTIYKIKGVQVSYARARVRYKVILLYLYVQMLEVIK